MGKFNRGERGDRGDRGGRSDRGSFGGGRKFGGDRGGFGRGDRERPTMHEAVCSECGKDCEVPFRPTGDKPVYCSYCFGKKEEAGGDRFERRSNDRSNDRSSFGEKLMFKAVCDKCGKDCEVPFRPTGDKPVFCSDCFGKTERGERSNNSSSNTDQYKKQFEMLNAKMDSILKMLSGDSSTKVSVEKKVEKKEKVEKPVVEEVKKATEKKKEVKKEKVTKKEATPKKKAEPKKAVKKVVAKKKK